MKKIISVLLIIFLLATAIPVSIASAETTSASETFELTYNNGFTLSDYNGYEINDNVATQIGGNNGYPAISINLNGQYYIEELYITAKADDKNIFNVLSVRLMSGSNEITKISASDSLVMNFAKNESTEVTVPVPADCQAKEVDSLRLTRPWINNGTDSYANLTVEKVVIKGKRITEQITLNSGDFTLTGNGFTVDGNKLISTTNQYPSFSINLPGEYNIKSIKVTATMTDTANNGNYVFQLGGDLQASLSSGGTSIQKTSSAYTNIFEEGKTKTYSMSVSEENQTALIDKMNFSGNLGAKPTAGAVELTIDKVEILGTCVNRFPEDENSQIAGDVNSDSKIDVLDLIRLKKYLCNIDVEYSFFGADCNDDGEINSLDLTALRVYLLTDSWPAK